MIATTLWNHSTYLCGDFSLLPTQLDDLLQRKNLAAWRVPFTGSDLSWTHPSNATDSAGRPYASPLDHLVWNGPDTPECNLAMSPSFSTLHRPIIVTTTTLGLIEDVPFPNDRENPEHNNPEPPTNRLPTGSHNRPLTGFQTSSSTTPSGRRKRNRNSVMSLDGIPDAGMLADKTTLNSDLKGVPTAEQFNPPSLTHTETTIQPVAHSTPPPSTAPTQSVRHDKSAHSCTVTLSQSRCWGGSRRDLSR